MIKQFSIDIQLDEEDKDFNENDLEKALFSYWYAEKAANREVVGVSWKATWNDVKSYWKGDAPDSYN